MSDQMELTESKGRQVAAPYNGDDLVMAAIQGGLPVETLEKLIAMRNADQDRNARKEFEKHFAEMQAEFSAVQRSRQGYDYKYATLDTIQKSYAPIIAKHGFSYRWNETVVENGVKRVTLTVSGYEHSEQTVFDVPVIQGTKQMNPIQVAGAMSTYGRRYTFVSAFGVVIEDEDTDAVLTFEDAGKYQEYITAIQATETLADLKSKATEIYRQFSKAGDAKGVQVVIQTQKTHKALLEQKTREGA